MSKASTPNMDYAGSLKVSKASTPNMDYVRYKGKADRLLKAIPTLEQKLPTDAGWIMLGSEYNVGAKLLKWMCAKGYLFRRYSLIGDGVDAWLGDWYKAVTEIEDTQDAPTKKTEPPEPTIETRNF